MSPTSAPPVPRLTFSIETTRFDEDYRPAEGTRITTNFANLARGEGRRENLRAALRMIDNRFNALASWDNEGADRYSVELDIVSVSVTIDGDAFPLIEMLQPTVVDSRSGRRTAGIVGNNFSSYVRDYDFSVVLPAYNAGRSGFGAPADFGVLHGNLFKAFLRSEAFAQRFDRSPVVCISVSTSKTYTRTTNRHPVLGVEYVSDPSPTDDYFARMGLQVRYLLPTGAAAPLAFYCGGDLLGDYGNLELIATISTMETFQRIYRPEIYNANASAGAIYRPDLTQPDFSTTRVVYDREERSRLAVEQGRYADETFMTPHRETLERWSAAFSATADDPEDTSR